MNVVYSSFLYFFSFFEGIYQSNIICIFEISRWESPTESRYGYFIFEFSFLYFFLEVTGCCFSLYVWIGWEYEFKVFFTFFYSFEEGIKIEVSYEYAVYWWDSTSEYMVGSFVSSWIFKGKHIKVFFYNSYLCCISFRVRTYIAELSCFICKGMTVITKVDLFFDVEEIFTECFYKILIGIK
jgi:hypothetical protein